jgi:DNA polymerase-1
MHIPILVWKVMKQMMLSELLLAKQKRRLQYFMVTPDKDFAQLVTDKIKIYKPAMKGGDVEILGVDEVKAKYEIEDPKQVIDFLAMMGDAVDNIPD